MNLVEKPNGKVDKPRAPFSIEGKHKVIILNWFKKLLFPDGYASNFRRGVNLKDKKLFGLKSHDYHIFIERLLPAAFRGFLPEGIWLCLSELNFFYRQLCAKQLSKDTVASLEKNIVVIMCKLEKIFPPGFFNPMQHLMIHLPCQARLAGPVQNTWMYRFERGIGKLRKKVRNKACVEGSIAEAYLVDEATNLFSLYFKSDVHSVRNKPPRYDDGTLSFHPACDLEMFQHPGRCLSYMGHYDLTTQEYKVALLYILTNMPEMDGFFTEFDTKYRGESIQTDAQQHEQRLNGSTLGNNKCPNFFSWFKSHCQTTSGVHNALRQMSYGFPTRVKTYGIYDVNGYRFCSEIYEQSRTDLASCNIGVCVTSFDEDDEDDNPGEYFGIVEEILQISWEGSIELELVIFKCRWFDPTSEGTKRTPNIGLVEVMHSSRIPNFDPFVLASQVKLVYYLPYACQSAALAPWWIVYEVPARDRIPHVDNNIELPTENLLVFQEDGLEGTFVIDIGDDLDNLEIPESYEITDPKELKVLKKLEKRHKNPINEE